MAQSYFEIERGLELSGINFIVGTGIPGASGDATTVGVGSYYMDDANGDLYTKTAAGSGTDKWKIQANKEYVDAVATGLDIKDSVRLGTNAALPSYTAAGSGIGKTLTDTTAGSVLSIDGIVVASGDRVLVKDEAASHADHGIYTLTTVGVASSVKWVLTRSTDADEDAEVTAGMFMFVEEGTVNSDQGWVMTTDNPITVDTTALSFSQFSGGDQTELANIRGFVGKTAAGAETPTYTENNQITASNDLEGAIDEIDQFLGADVTTGEYLTATEDLNVSLEALQTGLTDARLSNTALNVTTITTLDSPLVDTYAAAKWIVHIQDNAVGDKKRVVEILAVHDGYSGGDATDADYTVFAKLKMGVITGLTFTVDVSGAGASQVMNLKITSSTAVDVKTIREVIKF